MAACKASGFSFCSENNCLRSSCIREKRQSLLPMSCCASSSTVSTSFAPSVSVEVEIVVRIISWRATIVSNAACKASRFNWPFRFRPIDIWYAVCAAGSNWARNHRRCCDQDNGTPLSRDCGVISVFRADWRGNFADLANSSSLLRSANDRDESSLLFI
ncbi:hypothetical protein Xsze_03726 [Xenorhabdus szentirmaii DSM 16338]|nr:hypothetical protein Xsze_03726 [Xenorhabdus szentirmaii DSM 16338]